MSDNPFVDAPQEDSRIDPWIERRVDGVFVDRQGVPVAIPGLGPDAPVVTEANGAKQSHAPYAFTSIDPMVLFEVARIQRAGDEKYGPDNWRRLPEDDHINHALAHIYAHQLGDATDDHLGHAVVRMMFALAVHLRPDFHGKDTRDGG